jgi:alkylation response protein AidB-like acyl-CoA dehydrogenase
MRGSSHDQSQPHDPEIAGRHAALAKSFSTAKCRETVAWALDLLGGNCVVADCKAARFFADCEALYSYEGTYQMQNLIPGNPITGVSAFV